VRDAFLDTVAQSRPPAVLRPRRPGNPLPDPPSRAVLPTALGHRVAPGSVLDRREPVASDDGRAVAPALLTAPTLPSRRAQAVRLVECWRAASISTSGGRYRPPRRLERHRKFRPSVQCFAGLGPSPMLDRLCRLQPPPRPSPPTRGPHGVPRSWWQNLARAEPNLIVVANLFPRRFSRRHDPRRSDDITELGPATRATWRSRSQQLPAAHVSAVGTVTRTLRARLACATVHRRCDSRAPTESLGVNETPRRRAAPRRPAYPLGPRLLVSSPLDHVFGLVPDPHPRCSRGRIRAIAEHHAKSIPTTCPR